MSAPVIINQKRDVGTQADLNPQMISYFSNDFKHSKLANRTIPKNENLQRFELVARLFTREHPEFSVTVHNFSLCSDTSTVVCGLPYSQEFSCNPPGRKHHYLGKRQTRAKVSIATTHHTIPEKSHDEHRNAHPLEDVFLDNSVFAEDQDQDMACTSAQALLRK